jgi:putative tryptophan/tyrosine transport system substrate-binding protein
VRRREFIAGLGSAAAWPVVARAQQRTLPVVGYVGNGTLQTSRYRTAWLRGLAETGYVEGRNLTVEYRFADFRLDRLPALTADLVHREVALIIAGTTTAALAAKAATKSIPIVFQIAGDPVATGLVISLSRPGGNLTGVYNLLAEVTAKVTTHPSATV